MEMVNTEQGTPVSLSRLTFLPVMSRATGASSAELDMLGTVSNLSPGALS